MKKILIGSFLLILSLALIDARESELRPYRLINSDQLNIKLVNEEYVTKLNGNVHFFYGDTEFFGDEAEIYELQKIVRMKGNVKVVDDSLSLFAQEVEYFRISEELRLHQEVFIREEHQDGTIRTFKSDKGIYERNNQIIKSYENSRFYDERDSVRGKCNYLDYNLESGYGYIIGTPELYYGTRDSLSIVAEKIEFYKDFNRVAATFDVRTKYVMGMERGDFNHYRGQSGLEGLEGLGSLDDSRGLTQIIEPVDDTEEAERETERQSEGEMERGSEGEMGRRGEGETATTERGDFNHYRGQSGLEGLEGLEGLGGLDDSRGLTRIIEPVDDTEDAETETERGSEEETEREEKVTVYDIRSDFLLFFIDEEYAVFLGEPLFLSEEAEAEAERFYVYFADEKIERALLENECHINFSVKPGGDKISRVDAKMLELTFSEGKISDIEAKGDVKSLYISGEDKESLVNDALSDNLKLFFSEDSEVETIVFKGKVRGTYKFREGKMSSE